MSSGEIITVAQATENNRVDMSQTNINGKTTGPSASGSAQGSQGFSTASNLNGQMPVTSKADQEVDVVFLEELDKKFECPVCLQVLRFPVQFEDCGHRCCSACLTELLRSGSRCPLDDKPVDRETVYVDKAFQRDTDNLGVRCSFFERGCTWTGILKEIVEHLEVCNYRLVLCTLQCGVELEIRFLGQHQGDECTRRNIECQFCTTTIQAYQESTHLEICPKFPVPCPNGCKKGQVIREELAAHLESKCLRQEGICPFQQFGCPFQGVKKRLKQHILDETVAHLSMICETVRENDKRIIAVEKATTESRVLLQESVKRLGNLEKYWGCQMVWKIDNYNDKFQEAKSGKKTTIFSMPFYTGRQGYRIALSALLYGDGKARGKYMSLFACICRGEYDSLLTWPFNFPITMTLMDQCLDPEARRNISYVIRPNPCKENKPFLGRPSGERNASIGAQKFVELELLNTLDYLRDDTMYIKVNVDITDLPAL